MTPVHWIIQENQRDSLEVRAIADSLESAGHIPHLVRLSRGSEIPAIPDLPEGAPLVCHGPGFVTRGLLHPHLRTGIFFDPATFCWSAFRSGWKEQMLSTDGQIMSLSAAQDLLGKGTKAFIRPNSDSKVFDGGVYDSFGFIAATLGIPEGEAISVMVATPIDVEAEWRFFIVEKEVVGCSEYRRWGHFSTQGSVPHTAIELAAELASRWSPAAIYCLDLASTACRIGVVEANCFNASRMYAAVIPRILGAVNAYVLAQA